MKDLIFLLMFLPFVILALRNPFIGLCGWIWTIMAIPNNMLWGFASDIRFTYVIALATIIGMIFDKDPFRKPLFNGLFVLMVLFLLQCAISNTFTLGTGVASWAVWSDFFKAILFSGLCMMLLTTKNRIETFLIVLLLGAGFNIFFEGLKFLVSLGNYKIIGIQNSMMTDNNLFALAILMVLPLYMYMIPQARHKYLKLGFTGLAGLAAVCVIGSFSRGGFVGLLIVGWRIFLKVKRKFVFILFTLIFASSAIYVASDKWTDRIQTIDNAKEDDSFLGRVTAWKLATLAAMDRPFIGAGQDSVQHGWVWAYYYSDIQKFDFITDRNTPIEHPKASHSIYFQVLGDTGFIGLLLFLLILGKSLLLSKQLTIDAKQAWISNLGKSINTSLLVYLISGGLLSLAYYDLIYAMVSMLICLKQINQSIVIK
jgi:probable O-glycosylation ligase (exosortase A-associated)